MSLETRAQMVVAYLSNSTLPADVPAVQNENEPSDDSTKTVTLKLRHYNLRTRPALATSRPERANTMSPPPGPEQATHSTGTVPRARAP